MNQPATLMCPSAQHQLDGAKVFAVIGGTAEHPEVNYLEEALPVTPEVVAMAAPVDPAEVFRIAAPCANGPDCWHFDEDRRKCRLAIRTVRLAPVVVSKPPRCAIRGSCMWWHQEGVSACLRCPQVVTNDSAPAERVIETADPMNLAGAA
jgi:hypothetical protein